MKITNKTLALVVAVLLSTQSSLVLTSHIFAEDKHYSTDVKQNNHDEIIQTLPQYKFLELLNLQAELNLNSAEINFLKTQYLFDQNYSQLRWKASAVKKVIKIAKPILKEAAKKFGMKLAEKSFADFTDYLFEWEDNLENGIESFLINNWGWNETAAHWAAKTIMFVAF